MVASGGGEWGNLSYQLPHTDDPHPGGPEDAACPGYTIPLTRNCIYFPTRWESMIPVATAAFNDSACPILGMVRGWVACCSSSPRMPLDSFPMTIHPFRTAGCS